MSKKIALLTFFMFACYQYVFPQVVLKDRHPIESVRLKKGYAYNKFAANNRYLVWMEDYTGTLYIYDINHSKLKKKHLKKGRGPHEYSVIVDIVIYYNDKIILNDPKNIKWIIFNIEKDKYDRDMKFNSFKSSHLSSFKKDIFFLNDDFSNENSLYGIVNMENKSVKRVDMKSYSMKNEFSYIYKRSGRVTLNANYGIHLARYYPNIYVINKNKMVVQKKIKFDNSETKKGKTINTGNGNKLYIAPDQYDLLDKDVAFVPGKDHDILILADGVGAHRKYDPHKLQVFDFKKEKFIKTLDLGVKATEVTVNDDFLFAYSKSKNRIYQYKIVPDN